MSALYRWFINMPAITDDEAITLRTVFREHELYTEVYRYCVTGL